MDVGGSAAVPAGEDGLEGDAAVVVGDLVAAEELEAGGVALAGTAADVRVLAEGVAVPDVDDGAGDGGAGGGTVDGGDCEGERERDAGANGAGVGGRR